jgi:hypothetical protein
MPYLVWAHQGHLLTFPGRTTDPKAVALEIAELHGRRRPMLPRLSLPRAALMASRLKSSVGRLADRLLTGWSLVRIRPGEPNRSKTYTNPHIE